MFYKLMGSNTDRILERAMDGSALRSQLLAHNIANVNTPGYKRTDLDFAKIITETVQQGELPLAVTHQRHLVSQPQFGGLPGVIREDATAGRSDQNNVDVEFEMAKVTENSLYFQSVANSWRKRLAGLKMVIEGRV